MNVLKERHYDLMLLRKSIEPGARDRASSLILALVNSVTWGVLVKHSAHCFLISKIGTQTLDYLRFPLFRNI